MSGTIRSLPQYALMAWCSVKAQGQLYLYLYLYFTSNECRISDQDLICYVKKHSDDPQSFYLYGVNPEIKILKKCT
jgi:hypothetical protein